ncbi:alpha-(1-_3)-arabinofuranosyltransferase family protein, partial [Patescibacteria group bacterium]
MKSSTKKIIIDVILIMVVALISLSWFQGDLIVSGGDSVFNYNASETLQRYYTTWDDLSGTGLPQVQNLCQIFPYQTIHALADTIGVPLHIVQKLNYYILFAVCGLAMYFFARTTLSGSRYQRLPAILAALFYMFNPFALVLTWGGNLTFISFYAILPFFIGAFIKGIRDKKYIYIALIPFVGLLFSLGYSVTVLMALAWLLMFVILIFYILSNLKKSNRRRIWSAVKFTLLLVIVWLALNSFWLLPYFAEAGNLTTMAAYDNSTEQLISVSQSSSATEALRLLTYPPFFQKFMGIDAFYPYAETYNSFGFFILSACFTILALVGIIFSWKFYPKCRKFLLFFALLLGVAFFLFRGSNSIFGGGYVWMMDNYPWMVAFRVPIDKFGPFFVLPYTLFAGIGITVVLRLLFHKGTLLSKIGKNITLGAFVFLLVGVLMFPMWTGQVFYPGGKVRASFLTKPPSDYDELAEFLRADPETHRLLPIPTCGTWGCGLWWNEGQHGHSGGDPHFALLPKTTV